ncbi:hypothetical protein [Hyphomonas sp.]|uniref:hypothetical protein n=1 Tax=Hyphomonas sp. TaxID=87 RepID=UPI0030FC65EF
MATFGKKKARSSSAGVFGMPAHPSGNLSPEAQAFLEAELSMRQEKTDASAFPMPPKTLQAADASAGQADFASRVFARWFGKSSASG